MLHRRHTDGARVAADRAWRLRVRLRILIGIVLGCAILLTGVVRWRQSHAPWDRAGGMIGWTEQAVVARLGPPTWTIEAEYPDANGRIIRPTPPGPYRTMQFRSSDGRFIVWFHRANRQFVSFRSCSADLGRYY